MDQTIADEGGGEEVGKKFRFEDLKVLKSSPSLTT